MQGGERHRESQVALYRAEERWQAPQVVGGMQSFARIGHTDVSLPAGSRIELALLAMVLLPASYVPARRAMQLDPVDSPVPQEPGSYAMGQVRSALTKWQSSAPARQAEAAVERDRAQLVSAPSA